MFEMLAENDKHRSMTGTGIPIYLGDVLKDWFFTITSKLQADDLIDRGMVSINGNTVNFKYSSFQKGVHLIRVKHGNESHQAVERYVHYM